MKPLKISGLLIFDTLTFFSLSNVNAGGCSSHFGTKPDAEYLFNNNKCIDAKEKEFLYEVEV